MAEVIDWLDRTPAHHTLYEELISWARQHCSLEAQELINTMLIELYPKLVDSLDDELGCRESMDLQPDMKARQLKDLINRKFSWALSYREDCPNDNYWFWYRSIEKEEPRLGIRGSESGAEKETALAICPGGNAGGNPCLCGCTLTRGPIHVLTFRLYRMITARKLAIFGPYHL
ncbi:MAG: hypothetical protein KBT82_05310 [Marinobacter sp.]|uniref:hypothetical protein n=1 Tax=Marinobacter sp. TaxID=50741 RepID=UPI001B77A203|nr:hypothetical protein [Marinobacter sp.]MBQ0747088.1 hypothetical protein [Marinobacter sp.]MBQ0813583.1 hypothetical protein [Marinobacter sp.]